MTIASAPAPLPHCGHCGYPARGLPTFACPECGNDLRHVGIVAPGVRARPSRGERVSNWTILFVIGVIPLWMVADNMVVWRHLTQTHEMTPDSEKYRVRVVAIQDGYMWPFHRRRVRLELYTNDGNAVQLDLRGRHLAYAYSGSSGAQVTGAALSTEVILQWMKLGGVHDADDALQNEALDLLEIARAAYADDLSRRGMFYFSPGQGSYNGTGSGTNHLAIAGFFLVVWCIGAWRVWRSGI